MFCPPERGMYRFEPKKPRVPLLFAQAHNILKSEKYCHAWLGKTRHCSFIKIMGFLIKLNFYFNNLI